jgi:hypothetical protein
VLVILGIIFFIGELFEGSNTKEIKENEKQPKPQDKLQKKKERLEIVKSKIAELNPLRKKIFKTERRIFIGTRIVIATGFIIYNVLCLWLVYGWKFDLGEQMNINGAAVMLYSFIAFLLYGTPDNLVKEFKRKSKQRLKHKHIPMLSELKSLENEQKKLVIDIKNLEQEQLIIKTQNPKELNAVN